MRANGASRDWRQKLDLAQEVESQSINSPLDQTQWTLHGRRNRIFVLVSGNGEIATGTDTQPIHAPILVWVPSGQPARLTLFAGSRGAWLAISDAALGQIALPGNIAEDVRHLALRPQLASPISREVGTRLSTLIATMEGELRDNLPGAQEMVRHQLAIVCILVWRSSDMVSAAPQPTPRNVVNNFLHLVDQQMRQHWSVADYARYLGVSAGRLTSAVQRATGQTPQRLIHSRLMAEARQMLENSGMQIAEVSLSLGFEDTAYFSRFFKRLNGKSPREYRKDFARNQIRQSGSFAAWP
ncbi:helix-turn-helix domain-containing protein [Pelagibacterium lacus]|uniref:Helix-turn-helix domain-containing protein n=1 Tax=Pelagibacterium lacus TaxID=2282655 RepID=A0A369WA36_9HYPH|nr:helix-turn-helix domain-containing protein [Pelagibacterium lacus]RDE10142.1 helix-turn-helix domain-containing protein [Pelagibacterium lacus]